MTFPEAVGTSEALAGHYRPGLQGLERTDRKRIRASKPRSVRGSVNLEEALRAHLPNQPSGDYGIGLPGSRDEDQAIWVEVHPAFSHHVNEVLAKLRWLRAWLPEQASELERITTRYVWLASGGVAFSKNSPQRKQAAQGGLEFHSGVLRLDEFV